LPGNPQEPRRKHGKLRDLLELAGVKLATRLLAMLPAALVVWLCRELSGRVLYVLLRRSRTRAVSNLDMVFESQLSDRERRRLVRQVFRHFGTLAAEFLLLPRLGPEEFAFVLDEPIRELHQDILGQKPVIFVASHLGCSEILGVKSASLGFPLSSAARPLDNPYLDAWVRSIRETRGLQRVSPPGRVFDFLREALASETNVVCVADQNKRHRPVYVQFFGLPAATTRLPALLALRTGRPVVPAGAVRIGPFRYALLLGRPIYPQDGLDPEGECLRITQAYTTVFEEWIRRHPDQWLWTHRRWKRPPALEPNRKTSNSRDTVPVP